MTYRIFLLFLLSPLLHAQEGGPPDYSEMSLEDLMKAPTSVATKNVATRFSSPGVVSIITAADIENSGARDIIDLLMQVPGFDFGTDTQGVVGLAVRGNWAHEGKFFFLLDGISMNEIMYGTVPFGNRFPIDQISRIEIIRGPGSVVYGGTAEFAVINIITKSASELHGVQVNATYGQAGKDFERRDIGVSFGKKYGETAVSLSTHVGEGQRADKDYQDSAGNTFHFNNSSKQDPLYANLGITHGAFEFRAIAERYHTTDRTAYGVNLSKPIGLDFTSYNVLAKYRWKISSDLELIPEITYQNQSPWKSTDPIGAEIAGVIYDKTAQRVRASLLALQTFSSTLSAVHGLEVYKDYAKDNLATFLNGAKQVDYTNSSVFSELTWKPSLVDVHLGARFEYHNQFYSSFVPRLALVRSFGSWNLKGMYSRAFHAPTIENINSNTGIRPEKTSVAEIEVSNQVSSSLFVSANFFDIHVDSPIVYNYAGADSYKNFDHTGTFGMEIEAKLKEKFGLVSLGYSYYKKDDDNVSFYQVPGEDSLHLAFPAHKATLTGSFPIVKSLSFNPSLIYLSSRFGYSPDANGNLASTRFPDELLANAYLRYSDLLFKGFNAGLGVTNIFDVNHRIIQPYTGGHSPIPGASRELLIKADYHIDL